LDTEKPLRRPKLKRSAESGSHRGEDSRHAPRGGRVIGGCLIVSRGQGKFFMLTDRAKKKHAPGWKKSKIVRVECSWQFEGSRGGGNTQGDAPRRAR